jgi:hypothetical protein
LKPGTLLLSGLLLAPVPAALVSKLGNQTLADLCAVRRPGGDRRHRVDAGGPAARHAGRDIRVARHACDSDEKFLRRLFGDYRARSARKFGGNLPGAIHDVLVVSGPNDCVVLDAGVDYLEAEWDLYTYAFGRRAISSARTHWLRTSAAASKLPTIVRGHDSGGAAR